MVAITDDELPMRMEFLSFLVTEPAAAHVAAYRRDLIAYTAG